MLRASAAPAHACLALGKRFPTCTTAWGLMPRPLWPWKRWKTPARASAGRFPPAPWPQGRSVRATACRLGDGAKLSLQTRACLALVDDLALSKFESQAAASSKPAPASPRRARSKPTPPTKSSPRRVSHAPGTAAAEGRKPWEHPSLSSPEEKLNAWVASEFKQLLVRRARCWAHARGCP